MFIKSSLDRGRRRQRRRKNGVAYPYMGRARHIHVVFDVRVLHLNLSKEKPKMSEIEGLLDVSPNALQWRSQPDNLVMLCLFIRVRRP